MNRTVKKVLVCIIISVFVLRNIAVNASVNIDSPNQSLEIISNDSINNADANLYHEYLKDIESFAEIEKPIRLLANDKTYSKNETVTYTFHTDRDISFLLKFKYLSKEREDVDMSILIDGQIPFFESAYITLPTYWKDDGNIRIDNQGNEFAPEQVISDMSVWGYACDYSSFEEPFRFAVKAGEHTLTIKINSGSVLFEEIILNSEEKIEKYKGVENKKGNTNSIIELEAENASLKSANSLISKSDENSCDISPCDFSSAKVNYIGGSNWSSPGDTIVWDFEVKKSGYYYLGFIYRQCENLGGVSYRNLKIDGVTPFEEAKAIKFKFTSNWSYYEFSDNDVPYYFYLEEGLHELSLSVTSGDFIDLYKKLKETTTLMGDLYVDITMVVGETVDNSRSYELFNQIPQFNERLQESVDGLTQIVNSLEKIQEKSSGSNVSTIENAIITLQKMIDNPYTAHKYKSSYYSAYTNLSSLLGTITDMPLDIDRIFIAGRGSDFENPMSSFIEKTIFSIKRFLLSFVDEYSSKGNSSEEKLTIWVNWGRDQVQILDSMIKSDFSINEGIDVDLQLVNATILQAILSGDGPDVMLRMSRTEPVNLAMRGALYDLSKFNDYEDVMDRFVDGSEIPYSYKNGVYALPDTMGFNMMFIRTDIFESLNLEIPKTWDEFINVMSILQHKNLQVCLPYTQIADSSTVNAGVGALTLYPTLLLQNDLKLFNDELNACTLTEQPQIEVFKYWTDFYRKYKVPVTVSFYNRFRIGSCPLGIASYTQYTQFKSAAPEIEGRWTVTQIPGVLKGDGTIDNTSAGSGTGCSITKLSKNPDNAWKFLKWWTSANVQLKYSESVESVLGPLGRIETANVEALSNMVWEDEMKELLIDQMKNVEQIEEIPGSYYLARGIDQAFWNVTEQNADPTDQLLNWGAVVNKEIKRKLKEFS